MGGRGRVGHEPGGLRAEFAGSVSVIGALIGA